MRALSPLMLVLFLLPSAGASPGSEAQPGCEPSQPWILYGRSDPARATYHSAGAPGDLAVCEGEQWDGQDTLHEGATSCAGTVDLAPQALLVGVCQGADPNEGPGDDLLRPATFRVGAQGTDRAYASANVALVARVVIYADHHLVAVYARDNTPGNVLAGMFGPQRVTQEFRPDADCSQAVYQDGAYDPPTQCWRDNTALTVEHELLP